MPSSPLTSTPAGSDVTADQRLYTFHPRIVAVMSGGMGLSLIAVFGVIWFRLSEDSRDTFSWFQRLTLLAPEGHQRQRHFGKQEHCRLLFILGCGTQREFEVSLDVRRVSELIKRRLLELAIGNERDHTFDDRVSLQRLAL